MLVTVVPRAGHFWWLRSLRITKFSVKERESRQIDRYAFVVLDLATHWTQSYPCKIKTSQETQKNIMKCLEPTKKPKVIYIDNSLEFGKSCEELSWGHCTSTTHRSETNRIAEMSSPWSFGRDICSTVAIRSGQWMVGGFQGTLLLSCETFRISWTWWEDTPWKLGSEYHLMDQVIPFGAMVEYHPISAEKPI